MNEFQPTLPQEESVNPQSAADAQTTHPEPETIEQSQMPQYQTMSKDELLETLRSIVDNNEILRHKEVNFIKQAFYTLRKEEVENEYKKFVENTTDVPEDENVAFASTPDAVEAEFKDLLSKFKELRASYLEAEEERRIQNLEKKLAIIERLRQLASDVDNINLNISEVRQLQEDFKAIVEIPASKVSETWKSYQLVVEQIFDGLKVNKELRDLDFKKNLEIKRDLIRQAQDLQDEADPIVAFKKLQVLHDTWRETGPVAKEYREEVWDEFKQLSAVINRRHQEYFEARKESERINEEAKEALCVEIEAIDMEKLPTFKAWEEATEAIKQMQTRWKELGYASKKSNNILFARFRESCDKFFTKKAEFYNRVKDELTVNLEKKTALCERAEALKENENLREAADKARELMTEWKTIGSVPRRLSDSIWQRFMSAINHIYDSRKKQTSVQRKEENANLKIKRQVIEDLKSIPEDTSREDALKIVQELQAKWQSAGHVPFKEKDSIYESYRETLNTVRDKFDFRLTQQRMNRFASHIENMQGNNNALESERNRLTRALDQKRNELATYENNLGFFNIKSKEGNSMLKDMERRVDRIKEEISTLKKKIELIDNKAE